MLAGHKKGGVQRLEAREAWWARGTRRAGIAEVEVEAGVAHAAGLRRGADARSRIVVGALHARVERGAQRAARVRVRAHTAHGGRAVAAPVAVGAGRALRPIGQAGGVAPRAGWALLEEEPRDARRARRLAVAPSGQSAHTVWRPRPRRRCRARTCRIAPCPRRRRTARASRGCSSRGWCRRPRWADGYRWGMAAGRRCPRGRSGRRGCTQGGVTM